MGVSICQSFSSVHVHCAGTLLCGTVAHGIVGVTDLQTFNTSN